MNKEYIYKNAKEELKEFKGSWAYDDYFLDENGKKYFFESLEGDKMIPSNMNDNDIVEYIVHSIKENDFIHQALMYKLFER